MAIPRNLANLAPKLSATGGSFATTIGVGGATPAASGSGISFPATASASSGANTLDDYEEGSWTPVISDGTNNATMHGANGGTYIKVGKLVFIGAYVVQSSGGSVSGAIRITGLPFTVGGRAGVTAARGETFTITAGQSVGIAPSQGSTYADLFLWDSSAGSTVFLASEFGSGVSSLMFSLTYEASA